MVNKVIGKSGSPGFTLIEVLIVIVLIGMLSVVVINVIDPDYKVKVASDGVLMATMNKLVLSTEGFISAYSRVPNEAEFLQYLSIKGRELHSNECKYSVTPDYECLFFIEGINIPQKCDLSYWTGSDVNESPCSFRYKGEIMDDPGRFRIYVKSHGMSNRVFAYDNKEGGQIFDCPYTIADFNPLTDFCNTR